MTTIYIRHNFRLQTYRRTFTNYKKANWTQFTKDRIFTTCTNILLADKHNIPKGKMPNTSRYRHSMQNHTKRQHKESKAQ